MTRASLPGITKSKKIAEDAAKMYEEGLSIESVASELKVSYRCARKAIRSKGVVVRDPSARVKGRTSPKRKKKANE
jgi:orotate phosphoribosyltransferase-like protein